MPEWIDYNGHMNVQYYTMAFDRALDVFLEGVGLGAGFAAEHRQGPYAIQAQYHYLDELLLGENFGVRLTLLDCDAKRLHVFCALVHGGTGGISATLEEVIINVNLNTRRAAPFPDWAQAKFEALRAGHAALPRPSQAGAAIGLRR